MKIVNNLMEWEEFKKKVGQGAKLPPTSYPAVAWQEEEGGGLGGEYYWAYHTIIPTKYTESARTTEAWVEGFKRGKGF